MQWPRLRALPGFAPYRVSAKRNLGTGFSLVMAPVQRHAQVSLTGTKCLTSRRAPRLS